jgi:hypothetical protein
MYEPACPSTQSKRAGTCYCVHFNDHCIFPGLFELCGKSKCHEVGHNESKPSKCPPLNLAPVRQKAMPCDAQGPSSPESGDPTSKHS